MLGLLVRKDGKAYPIVSFSGEDKIILKGDLMEFETSLKKSVNNGYSLQECNNDGLLSAFQKIMKESHGDGIK